MSKAPSLGRRDYVINTHLHHAWCRARVEGLDQYLGIEREERVFSLVGTCDPTPESRYLAWLSSWRRRQWAVRGLRGTCSCEELGELAFGLHRFELIRRRLPTRYRDIGRYTTARELIGAESHVPALERRRLQEEERSIALAGSDLLVEAPPWRLVGLRTIEASLWWGQGTRWCTAARSANAFHRYANEGRLLVLTSPSGKYQLALPSGEFRNSEDGPADLRKVLAQAPMELRSLLKAQLS